MAKVKALFENSVLTQMNSISQKLSIATMPLSNIGSVTSQLFENSALTQMNSISQKLSIATMPLSNIGSVTSQLFENSTLFQLESKLKFISENINPITELDIEELLQFEIKTVNNENLVNYNNSIEILEEFRVETLNNKFRMEEINQKLEELFKLVQKQTNSIITNFLLGIISAIIFTYCIQPIINNFILNKSQINKILVPEIKRILNPTEFTKYRIVVAKSYLNVRTKPRLKSNIIFHLSNGDLVEIVNKQKNWTLVKKYDSEYETVIQGWVSTKYLLRIN